VCRLQFLLEKLNYRRVRGEQMTYLHLYPYSFRTDVFLNALRGTVEELLEQDVGVLFLKTDGALRAYVRDREVRLNFTALRKNGRPQVNGIYLPRYAETVGNVLIFPLNPPGQNDSERFLFALYNGLLFQKHFGCKALLSGSAVPPLGPTEFGDLFVADVPLAFRGLLPEDGYDSMGLEALWGRVRALHELLALVYTPATQRNEMLALVRALGEGSWPLFATAGRLLEARVKADQQARDKGWLAIRLAGRMIEHLNTLVQPRGGETMKQLQELAEIAWQGKLKGQTWERSSLLKPFDIIFDALESKSEAFGVETVRAQVNTEIFEHLYRIAPNDRKPGRPKRKKVKEYVAHFFDQILASVYSGTLNHLLADAKGLRAAYLFYLREQIDQSTTTD
jgi:CRISPR-associated protein Csc3